MCPFCYCSVVNVVKVWRQKDICMGKNKKDMCHCSYWRGREVNSEYRGKFHQSAETKKVICRSASSFEVRLLSIVRTEQFCNVTCVTHCIELTISYFLNTCKMSTGIVLCDLTLKPGCQLSTLKLLCLSLMLFMKQ